MIVVDASVALKWFIPENGMTEAFRVLRSGKKLVAPAIIREEVISGLVRRVRREELASSEAQEAVTEWMRELHRQTVHLIEDNELLFDAAALGFELRHPLFDCIYVALADRMEAPLVTADQTLLRRATETGHNVFELSNIYGMLAA